MTKKTTLYIVQAAVIAALYATLTTAQALLIPGSTSMAVQFRVAEAMTILAFFTPVAIPGLTVGCILANILGGLGPIDMVFGSLATLLAVSSMWMLRKLCVKGIPFVGLLMPAVFNGLIVGFEIEFFFVGQMKTFNFADFLIQGGLVALGEVVVLFVLGIPLTLALKKHNLTKQLKG